jgi:hypothetical protein
MVKSFKLTNLIVCIALLSLACGGGGDSGDGGGGGGNGDGVAPDIAILEGTWFGTIRDDTDNIYTMAVTFDDEGNIVIDSVDGNPVGDTATLTEITSTLFSMVDSNNIRGMVVVDAQALHLGWMDEENNIGVLQKNATQLPIFNVADIDGQWSGEGFWCDANMDFLIDDLQSDMSVNKLVFSVQDNYNTDINGSFLAWWSHYGAWRGLYNPNVLGESGSFTSLVTVDKNFMTTFSIDNSNGPGICPQDCRYRFLSRR